ncbi:hypothetical protein EPN81_00985 [Patescibacteria group bacterium]|nr:MAG: hypothetical protein EPN81_00985 [Patescibacteria group bacterium]
MPVSISISDLNREFNTQTLLHEIQTAVQKKVPEFAGQVEYHVRADEKISVSLPGIVGLLEIELDDSITVHVYCSMYGTLEKLRISLGVLDYLTEKYEGEYDTDEIRLLRSLLG